MVSESLGLVLDLSFPWTNFRYLSSCFWELKLRWTWDLSFIIPNLTNEGPLGLDCWEVFRRRKKCFSFSWNVKSFIFFLLSHPDATFFASSSRRCNRLRNHLVNIEKLDDLFLSKTLANSMFGWFWILNGLACWFEIMEFFRKRF